MAFEVKRKMAFLRKIFLARRGPGALWVRGSRGTCTGSVIRDEVSAAALPGPCVLKPWPDGSHVRAPAL